MNYRGLTVKRLLFRTISTDTKGKTNVKHTIKLTDVRRVVHKEVRLKNGRRQITISFNAAVPEKRGVA